MLLVEHLIDKPMLDVDAAGVSTGEIPDELFEGRRAYPRIGAKNIEQLFRFVAKAAVGDLSGILLRLLREYDPPRSRGFYQPAFSDVFERGVRKPLRIDSRMPGIDRR